VVVARHERCSQPTYASLSCHRQHESERLFSFLLQYVLKAILIVHLSIDPLIHPCYPLEHLFIIIVAILSFHPSSVGTLRLSACECECECEWYSRPIL